MDERKEGIKAGFIVATILISFIFHVPPAKGDRALTGNNAVPHEALPASKEGKFPIHIPEYQGVEQLLLLNNQWVVLGVSHVKEITDKINELSGGELKKADEEWQASEKAGKPNWRAFKAGPKIRGKYMGQARTELGEKSLNDSQYYFLSSDDDSRFKEAQHPQKVTSLPRSLGGKIIPCAGRIHWGSYCFLKFPQTMENGKHYSIRLGNGKKVTFLYDEMATISRAIKVNQVGYLPNAGKKYAYLGASLYDLGPLDLSDAKKFRVINVKTGKVTLEGNVELVEKNPRFAPRPGKNDDPQKRPFMYGEDVYRMDLTPLKENGDFFITVPGVGRSWAFHHGADAYGEAFYVAARGLYHQRCGIDIKKPFSNWPRKKSSMHDTIYEAEYVSFPRGVGGPKNFSIFDAVGGTFNKSRKTEHVIGGWHDAADWDRNSAHYSCIFDMLNAYEMAPKKFTDGQLNIPESGNGIPDILDEVIFGLEVWKKSMNKKGGVSGFVETNTHPSKDAKDFPYAYSMRTRWDSLVFAAASAQLANALKASAPKLAAEYENLAKRAYAFGEDKSNSLGKKTFHAKRKRGAGEPYTYEWEEKEEYVIPFRIHAKMQLYKLTGDKSYLVDVPALFENAKKPWEWRFCITDFSNWLYFDIAQTEKGVLPEATIQKAKALYLDKANQLLKEQAEIPYAYTYPRYRNYRIGWGSSSMANYNRPLACAYALTGDKKYRDATVQNMDFMLGANPLGMSWTTGLGYSYPIDFQHHVSEDDGIMDPVPGIMVYGITTGPVFHKFRNGIWENTLPDGKKVSFIKEANKRPPLWRNFMQHPNYNTAKCEFTVHETMAGNIFSAAFLLDKSWKPSEEIKNRRPRDKKYLFGYWQLP